ncbi:MAG: MarR family winged helix-turn-helix transcriptional regulator [Actinomycetota bacterium]
MGTRVDRSADVSDLLVDLVDAMRQHFIAVAADLDLTPPQLGVLKHLDEPLPISHVATGMGCDASNITWMTDRLEQRGLVERRPDPPDRRVKQLALTEAGRRLRRQMRRFSRGYSGANNERRPTPRRYAPRAARRRRAAGPSGRYRRWR